jgi:hypothetical protein
MNITPTLGTYISMFSIARDVQQLSWRIFRDLNLVVRRKPCTFLYERDNSSELSMAVGQLDSEDLRSLDVLLKAMGLSLNDPSVWIGDTGATTHNTAYIVDTVNHWRATAADHIVGVTGPPAEAKTIVDIHCQLENCGTVQYVKLKDVAYPDSCYNLFSLTKLMASGWSIGGNAEVGIKMSKGVNVLHFNKTVHTPKGVLYVIVMKRRGLKDEESKELTMAQVIVDAPHVEDASMDGESAECGAAVVKVKPITVNKAGWKEQQGSVFFDGSHAEQLGGERHGCRRK